MASKSNRRPSAVVKEMAKLTGLDQNEIDRAFSAELGISALEQSLSDLPLDQLRLVLLNYLDAIHQEMKIIDTPSAAVGKMSQFAQ